MYGGLPGEARIAARQAYSTFQSDPFRRGLGFKELRGHPGVWSVRIGEHYRALGRRRDDRIAWFWIGSHAEYDRMLSGREVQTSFRCDILGTMTTLLQLFSRTRAISRQSAAYCA